MFKVKVNNKTVKIVKDKEFALMVAERYRREKKSVLVTDIRNLVV